jgi:hypothetical protein
MAMNHLARQFFEPQTTPVRALVWGDMEADSGTFTSHIVAA